MSFKRLIWVIVVSLMLTVMPGGTIVYGDDRAAVTEADSDDQDITADASDYPDAGEDFAPFYANELSELLAEYPAEAAPADGRFANCRLIVWGRIEEKLSKNRVVAKDISLDGAKVSCDSVIATVERTDHSFILQFADATATESAYYALVEKGFDVIPDEPLKLNFSLLPGYTESINQIPAAMNMSHLSDNPDYRQVPVTVAVLDTGVSSIFDTRLVTGYLAMEGKVAESLEDTEDTNGHGTGVASIVLDATADNVSVMPVVITDESGNISVLSVENGILYGADHADVINMSLDYTGPDAAQMTYWNLAIDTAIAGGVPVVVASGNGKGSTQYAYPACYEPCWTVGSVDDANKRADFSNYGSVDFMAPGVGITCIKPDGTERTVKGTSFSTPAIAAFAAQLMGDGDSHSVEELYETIKSMCLDLGDQGYDNYYGYGMPVAPHIYEPVIGKATLKENGIITWKCIVCEKTLPDEIIYHPETIKLAESTYTYTGKAIKPKITVIGADGKTISAQVTVADDDGKTVTVQNYEVTWPAGRKNVGTYTVTIKFKGIYTGKVTRSFTILPKGTAISSLSALAKGFTVKWKKQAVKMSESRITGYQIQIATNSRFTAGKKIFTVTGYKTISKKITNLKAKKKYWVRIRTYKTVNGRKKYSAWSKAKTVTTKE